MLPKYKVFDHKNIKDLLCILIESGAFEGIIYHYGTVSVDQLQEKDGEIPVKYTYEVVDGEIPPDKIKEFQEVISSILFNLITGIEEVK